MTRQLATGILASVLVSSACGQNAEQQAAETAKSVVAEATKTGADQMAQGAAAMAQSLDQMSKGLAGVGKVDVLPFEKLGEALPEVSGWKRGEITGKSVSMPFAMSQSEATYENGEARIEVEVIDTALNQMIIAPFSMYLVQNFSERSTDGYRKGTTVKGQPAFEEVDTKRKRGELTVVVGKRFIVHARGRDVNGVEPARAVLDAMDFGKLTAAK